MKDLVEFGGWDMASPGATVGLLLRNNVIDQCLLNLVGESDPKRLDARTVFGEEYKGGADHQVRKGKNLSFEEQRCLTGFHQVVSPTQCKGRHQHRRGFGERSSSHRWWRMVVRNSG